MQFLFPIGPQFLPNFFLIFTDRLYKDDNEESLAVLSGSSCADGTSYCYPRDCCAEQIPEAGSRTERHGKDSSSTESRLSPGICTEASFHNSRSNKWPLVIRKNSVPQQGVKPQPLTNRVVHHTTRPLRHWSLSHFY